MEYIDIVVRQIIDNFDFAFMFVINVLTYLIIKVVGAIDKERVLTPWQKRIILLIVIILMAIFYRWSDYNNDIRLLNSAILAPVFWSWVLRPIFIKLGIGYKKYDDTLN